VTNPDAKPRFAALDAPAAGLARFLHRAGALKSTKRTGWLDRGVPADQTESVADHTWRTALLAWFAAALDPTLDADRVLKLAMIHDLAEAITGDHPPYDPAHVPDGTDPDARRTFLDRRHVRADERRAAKRAAEAEAIASLLAELPPALGEPLAALWQELEEEASPEAHFVKQADKIETYLQSREYQALDPDRPMASFAAEVAVAIPDPVLADLRDAIAALPLDPEPRPS
jgi:putative hydrolase of HD superfamily